MRFNPQENTGSPVQIRYTVQLNYALAGPAEFLLIVHAATTPHQTVLDEHFALQPALPFRGGDDPATGNRIATFNEVEGALRVDYSALVQVEHYMIDPKAIEVEGQPHGIDRPRLTRASASRLRRILARFEWRKARSKESRGMFADGQ